MLVVRRRIKRSCGIREEEIDIVDEEEVKSLRELGIPTVFETSGFEDLEFREAPVKLTKRAFKELMYETDKAVQVRWKYHLLKFEKTVDLRRVQISSPPIKLIRLFMPSARYEEVILKKFVSRLEMIKFEGAHVVKSLLPSKAAKFRDLPILATNHVTFISRLNLIDVIPLQVFTSVSVKAGPMLEEQVLEGVAYSLELTSILFRRSLSEIGLRAKYVGEPIIIILPKPEKGELDYHYVILEICKELYREAKGGFPKPYIFINFDQFKEFISLGEKFYDKIILFDLKDDEKYWDMLEEFKCAFREMFSQGLGFMVFISKDPARLRHFIEEEARPYMPKIVDLSYVKVNEARAEIFRRAVEVLWGTKIIFVEPNDVLSQAERRYKDVLDELLGSKKYTYLIKRGEKESEDHLALKILALKHLVEVEKIKLEDVKVEEKIEEVVADIYVKDQGLVVEVETLYGAGSSPLLNVKDSVLKYKNIGGVKEVWVILRNFPTALHLGDLWSLRKFLRDEMKEKEKRVEIYLPILSELKLNPLGELIKKLKSLKMTSSHLD